MTAAREVHPGIWALSTLVGRAFLIETDAGVVLFDTGARGSARRILAALKARGHRPDAVARIVLSHYHPDHIGAAKELRTVTQAPTIAHARDADVIRGDRAMPRLKREGRLALVAPLLDLTARFDPCPVDVVLPDEVEQMPLGIADLSIVYTPGHTMGSISLIVPGKRTAMLGDALFNLFNRLSISFKFDTEDRAAAVRTARRIADLEFDVACFGHGRVITRDAGRRVREFAAGIPDGVT